MAILTYGHGEERKTIDTLSGGDGYEQTPTEDLLQDIAEAIGKAENSITGALNGVAEAIEGSRPEELENDINQLEKENRLMLDTIRYLLHDLEKTMPPTVWKKYLADCDRHVYLKELLRK